MDPLIAKIDATMAVMAASSPQHQEAQQRVETIVGVGPLVGISLTTTLERVPFRKADAFVAFMGLDPRPRRVAPFAVERRDVRHQNQSLETDLRIVSHSSLEHDRLVGDHCSQNCSSRLVHSSLPHNL